MVFLVFLVGTGSFPAEGNTACGLLFPEKPWISPHISHRRMYIILALGLQLGFRSPEAEWEIDGLGGAALLSSSGGDVGLPEGPDEPLPGPASVIISYVEHFFLYLLDTFCFSIHPSMNSLAAFLFWLL